MTNTLCWAKFERVGLGKYKLAALSWMFRHSKIPWQLLLQASTKHLLKKYGITEGVLIADDTDKKRAKVTKRIYKTHKLKQKTTGGYFMGQSIVMLLLVTPVVTIPVGFEFYMPDPALTKWYKEESRLKKLGVAKKERPSKPERNPHFPTKKDFVLKLIRDFKKFHPTINVKAIGADNFYGSKDFIDTASSIYGKIQVVSQLRSNQLVRFRNNGLSLEEYFQRYPGVAQKITIRGGEEITVFISSARLFVSSHAKKRFIIALKYSPQEEYRYLVACDLSWRTKDIVQAYSYRWLAEVFFQDFKSYQGFGQLAKQFDEEGSSRSLVLSLLLDHCLLFHPEQQAQLENKLPAFTVGSLLEKTRVMCLLEFIHNLLSNPSPQNRLESLIESVQQFFSLALSNKHMSHRDMGNLDPLPSLKHRAGVCSSYV